MSSYDLKRGGLDRSCDVLPVAPPRTSHEPPRTSHEPPRTSHEPPRTSHDGAATLVRAR